MKGISVWFGVLLFVIVGGTAGWAVGDLTQRYRKALRRIKAIGLQPDPGPLPLESQLRQILDELDAIHELLRTVTKSLEKRPS